MSGRNWWEIATRCLNLNSSQETVRGYTHAKYAPIFCIRSSRKLATTEPRAHVTTNIYSNSQTVGFVVRYVVFVGDSLAVEYISTVYAPYEGLKSALYPIDSSRHLLG